MLYTLASNPGNLGLGIPLSIKSLYGSHTCTISIPPIPTTIVERGVILSMLGSAVYAFGGRIAGPISDGTTTVLKYDMATNTWANIAPMSFPKYEMTVIDINDEELLIAGN